jgi:hypothetical protein
MFVFVSCSPLLWLLVLCLILAGVCLAAFYLLATPEQQVGLKHALDKLLGGVSNQSAIGQQQQQQDYWDSGVNGFKSEL